MQNYEKLGYGDRITPELNYDRKVEKLAVERQEKAGSPRIRYWQRQIEIMMTYPCWKHLGVVELPDVRDEVEEGFALAVEYFHGDWWTEEGVRRVEKNDPEKLWLSKGRKTVENIIAVNAQHLDRSNPDCLFEWHKCLRSGMLLGALLGKWGEVGHLCSWVDAAVKPEYSAGTVVDEYYDLYLCMAGQLSTATVDGLDDLLSKVRKCRQKRVRLLTDAWESAIAGDQAAFDKAFPKLVSDFVRRPDDPFGFMWVAMDESIIGLIAKHHGLTLPEMNDKKTAAIMTAESIGLTT